MRLGIGIKPNLHYGTNLQVTQADDSLLRDLVVLQVCEQSQPIDIVLHVALMPRQEGGPSSGHFPPVDRAHGNVTKDGHASVEGIVDLVRMAGHMNGIPAHTNPVKHGDLKRSVIVESKV
jgi:hypothetical protein